MSAEFEHLQASQRAVAQLSNEERIDWIRQERWIQYPRARCILERLSELVDYPPRHRMPCLAIYGSTGMGKTRIVQKFLRDNRAHFDRKLGRTRLPVVSIQMPPEPNLRDLYEEILIGMGGVFSPGTSVTTLRHRIRALVEQLEMPHVDHRRDSRSAQRYSPTATNPLDRHSPPRQRPTHSAGVSGHRRSQSGTHDR